MGVSKGSKEVTYWITWSVISAVLLVAVWRIGTQLGRIADALGRQE